jgi:hypothetical protein
VIVLFAVITYSSIESRPKGRRNRSRKWLERCRYRYLGVLPHESADERNGNVAGRTLLALASENKLEGATGCSRLFVNFSAMDRQVHDGWLSAHRPLTDAAESKSNPYQSGALPCRRHRK